jgi:hypothetical protein
LKSKILAILVFAFVPNEPESNRQIADMASYVARNRDAKIYTQQGVPVEVDLAEFMEEGGYPPSFLQLANWAIVHAVKDGAGELRVVAAGPQLDRAWRITGHVNFKMGSPLEITYQREIRKFPIDQWYNNPESVKTWARDRKVCERRERILKYLPIRFHKLLAA